MQYLASLLTSSSNRIPYEEAEHNNAHFTVPTYCSIVSQVTKSWHPRGVELASILLMVHDIHTLNAARKSIDLSKVCGIATGNFFTHLACICGADNTAQLASLVQLRRCMIFAPINSIVYDWAGVVESAISTSPRLLHASLLQKRSERCRIIKSFTLRMRRLLQPHQPK
jgi:hypothetical protein